jgi:hypothetical protein
MICHSRMAPDLYVGAGQALAVDEIGERRYRYEPKTSPDASRAGKSRPRQVPWSLLRSRPGRALAVAIGTGYLRLPTHGTPGWRVGAPKGPVPPRARGTGNLTSAPPPNHSRSKLTFPFHRQTPFYHSKLTPPSNSIIKRRPRAP